MANVKEIDGHHQETPPTEVVLSIGEVVIPTKFEELNTSNLKAVLEMLVGVELALNKLILDANGEVKIYLISYRNRLTKILTLIRTIQDLIGRTLQNSPKVFVENQLKILNKSLTSLQSDLVSYLNSTQTE